MEELSLSQCSYRSWLKVSNVSIIGLREEILFLKKLANALSFVIVVCELSLYSQHEK